MLQRLGETGAPGVVDEMLPKLLGATTRARQPELVERVRRLALANSPEAISGALRALMTRPDATPLLQTIRCPSLILVGEEDVITPPELSEQMRSAIAGSELVRIPEAGHLSSVEQPDAFNGAVTRFLAHRL
jgi:pimeloyl-ACP methyl ester carboxylesterase